MSALTRDPSHNSLKSFKFALFPNEKNTDFFATLLKGALLVFLLTSISLVLYSAFATQTGWFGCPECHRPVQRSARSLNPTNISHVLFGIAGSVKTWHNRRHYSELWWKPGITRGYVWLDGKPDSNKPWPESSPPYRVSEDWSRFKYSSSRPAVRIARIVMESFRLGLPDVRWFVMGDDDTVFFPDNLVSVLANYDHRQMYYIGGISESVEQDVRHSYGMAFGGGGFAVSYPLAAELVKVLDGCLDRYHTFYGSDQRVWACVSEIGVSLTRERGFHQIDVRGDPYGLLAAHPLTPLVSLHHLEYVEPLFPNQTRLESLGSLMQAYRVDPARTVQQSFCYHPKQSWSVSVSWGYTVQLYPWLLTAKDLETPLGTFKTWRSWQDGPFIFNTRPVNPDPCDSPIIYFLEQVKEDGKGSTLSTYRRHVAEPSKICDKAPYAPAMSVDTIRVSALKMDPEEWSEAPRRQCCEISKSLTNNAMRVKIRQCKPRETITS
ncbi:uncharacterized protein LOC132312078 [Cornus florida]|uniref:uncharacterized protein LOC132312078 n=1 Tax=Cornus florida TaxID=4283 RepID=UPI00289760A2|nr:uncharacterized protein LOC132312078 [Cornus florida]